MAGKFHQTGQRQPAVEISGATEPSWSRGATRGATHGATRSRRAAIWEDLFLDTLIYRDVYVYLQLYTDIIDIDMIVIMCVFIENMFFVDDYTVQTRGLTSVSATFWSSIFCSGNMLVILCVSVISVIAIANMIMIDLVLITSMYRTRRWRKFQR